MEKFKRGYLPEVEPESLMRDFNISREEAIAQLEAINKQEVYVNDIYQVNIDRSHPHFIWLSIKRRDKTPVTDWRQKQTIKNELVGEEHEAVELYPAESRLVDTSNQYHLWAAKNKDFRFPLGFPERAVEEEPGGNAVQRSFDE